MYMQKKENLLKKDVKAIFSFTQELDFLGFLDIIVQEIFLGVICLINNIVNGNSVTFNISPVV